MNKVLLILITLLTFTFGGILAHFYNRTDDLSLRYVFWKKGLYPYPADIIWQGFIADQDRDELIRGKSKDEIKQLFPTAHEEAVNDYQKQYEKQLAGKEYLWLGDWGVVILFENGTAESVSVMKG